MSKLDLMIANLQALSVNFLCLFLDQDREQGTLANISLKLKSRRTKLKGEVDSNDVFSLL